MPSPDNWPSHLVCRFMAELLGPTISITDDVAYQRTVQAFVDELQPWMPPVSGPPRSHASLFSRLELDDDTGEVSAEFTPEGLACFRGWLRRQGLDPMMSTS